MYRRQRFSAGSWRLASTMILALGLLGSTSCSNAAKSPSLPAFVEQLIAEIKAEPARNPPAKILRYEYDGQTVYFVPQHCCDMTSELYSSDGERLCAPDGGITGRGDGQCSDFFETRRKETLIWEDPRKVGAR